MFHLAGCITSHAWNADRSSMFLYFLQSSKRRGGGEVASHIYFFPLKTEIAVCPNNSEVHIFGKTGATWNLEHVLAEV